MQPARPNQKPAAQKTTVQPKPQEAKPVEVKKPAEVKHVDAKPANPKPAVKPAATNVKAPEKAKQQAPAQVKPVVAQKQQQPQEKKQDHKEEVPAAKKIKISQSIKLPQMLAILDQDKSENLTSLLIDTTGNAFTFFKYKGEVIDVSEMIVKQNLNGVAKKDNVEKARKTLVYALQAGGSAVFHLDIASTNLGEQFNAPWYKPEKIFQYSEILKKDYYKKDLITPDEDVDHNGNKGWYEANQKDFRIVIVAENKVGETDPYEFLKKLGLEKYQHYFRATQIVN